MKRIVKNYRLTRRLAMFFVFAHAHAAFSITMPGSMALMTRVHQNIDPEFADWLKNNANVPVAMELENAEFMQQVAKQDQVTGALMQVLRYRKDKVSGVAPGEKRPEFVATAWKVIEQENAKPLDQRHVLTGDLAASLVEFGEQAQIKTAQGIIEQEPVYSCVRKAQTLGSVQKSTLEKMDSSEINELINLATKYDSLTHRRKLLDVIATGLAVKRRTEFADSIRDAGGNLPLLMRRHDWLMDASERALMLDPWHLTMKSVRKNDCAKSTKDFNGVLKDSRVKIAIDDTMEVGQSIEKCWRKIKRQAAIDFWDEERIHLKSKFGELGNAWTDVRRGYLLWAYDRNDEAVEVYSKILEATAGKPEYKAISAKSIYTLGKIAENRSDFDRAIELYSKYVDGYSEGEDFEYVLNSLVVSRASKNQWNELIQSLRHYLDQQALVSLDQRPVGNMAFSLFWLGRAYVSQGQPEMAKEMWRRLAAEYYSTFYGAMGHFLLERTGGKVYALEPSRVSGFKFESLLTSLSAKQKRVVAKTTQLLRAGLYEQARCEVDEINTQEKNNWDLQLVRALLLHTSGSWLEAIKLYDAMPRSVRNSLPVGFERILFPRRYSDLVQTYSSKLGIDADLVFAVMRQESVFAKEAMSPVGAMGLMQLMPTTAALEITKLPHNYVTSDQRAVIQKVPGDGLILFDPEVNVPLGVHHLARLLQLYKSPVFALTAYNASPAATIKWKKTIATDDLLTFIERIPYKETRAYVKLIMRNYFYYKRWYGPSRELKEIHLESLAKDLIAMAKKSEGHPP